MSNHSHKKHIFLFSLLFLFPLRAEAQLRVVATTPDFGAIASEIGGEKVEVATLGRPAEDPHFVDAKPSFILKLNRADVLVEGGAELEIGWLPALLEQSRNEKIAAGAAGHISCSQVVSLLEVPSTLDRSKGDVHAAGNPHYMVDPENAKKVANLISESFCTLDSSNCELFREHLKNFSERLDKKLVEWQASLSPFRGSHLVAYHNSWPYFAKRFGLVIDLYLEPKPGIPPTPANLADVMAKIKAGNIRAIIVDPYLNRRTAESVAENTGAAVVDVAQFPGAFPGTENDYLALMDRNVNALVSALAGNK